MRALQLTGPGTMEVREVPVPEVGPNDLLVRVGAVGICHSDLYVLELPFALPNPLIMGHEVAGTVAAVGSAVGGIAEGERGLIYLCWSCGMCRECVSGNENVCRAAGRTAMPPCPGLGPDGGMAEYIRVPASSFVAIGDDLEFGAAAPLADAALTSYHAVRGAREQLYPGATAVCIGIGGLGHVAVQILKTTDAVRVIAVDVGPDKLELAAECGADLGLLAGADTAAEILELTGGRGAEAVFDFVGTDATAGLAVRAVAPNGAYRMVGLGGGAPELTAGPAGGPGWPWGATVRKSYGGTKSDLIAAVELARAGRVRVAVERFDLTEGRVAFDRLARGEIRGRAVLIP
ncbi:NAD(P)-dependent alcohol dehydrogenase [Nocardia sp. BMG51109]|uniref:NAD(P)-dependent alcohol dehydrogenase n=1 Tax=Nocardia sp. BMG51109 TaxID=1056816 RepID=UPI0004675B09|nr:NAD(P)-dependent alcohol dehydrogenase [Nocardia sp. BMG51109]